MLRRTLLLALAASLSISVLPVVAGKVPEKRYKVKWQERNNRILHRSVCHNHDAGSIPYRRCRVQAKQLFVQKCRHFENKYEKTQRPYNKKYRKRRDKFCYSADAFFPI